MRGLRVLDGPPTCAAHRALAAAAGSSILHVAVAAAIAVFGSASLPGGQQAPLAFDVILVADPGLGAAPPAPSGETRETPGETVPASVAAVAALAPPPRSDPETLSPPVEIAVPEEDAPEDAGEPAVSATAPVQSPVESPDQFPEIDLGALVAEAPRADPAPRPEEPKAEEEPAPKAEASQALPRPPVKPRRLQAPALASLLTSDLRTSDLRALKPDPQPPAAAQEPPRPVSDAAGKVAGAAAGATASAAPDGAQADSGAARAQDGLALVTDPRFRRPPRAPVYPQRAVELDQQGTVLVRALVREDGSAERAIVWRSSGFPLLDAAAAAAVRGWEFEPLRLAGMPQAAWVQIPVKFSLKE